MLKHLAIATSIAALLVGFSAGYLSATTNLNTSRSNIYKTGHGVMVPYSYTFSITVPETHTTGAERTAIGTPIDPITRPVIITAADRKAILSEVCSQLLEDISPN
jgi:hypothetical protein